MKNFVTWAPRVFSVILIGFISMFALDGFVPGASGLDNTLSVLIGILPAVILTLALVLAWFFRLAGGITFTVLGVIMTIFFHTYRSGLSFLSLSLPVLIVGVLFLLSYFYEKSTSVK